MKERPTEVTRENVHETYMGCLRAGHTAACMPFRFKPQPRYTYYACSECDYAMTVAE